MAGKKRVHILTAVNADNVTKSGATYVIKDVCGAVDALVMNGMLYPGDQLAAAAPTLTGKPAPAGHPKNSAGQFISAVNGEALQSAYIGSICTNARHASGRTLVDIVVNEKQAKASDAGARLIERLDAALAGTNTEPIHVSTGLFCEVVNAAGESMGKRYDRIATNIAYDHLAILLDEPGAGTPEQGVGMFLNAAGEEGEVETCALIVNAADTAKAEKSLRDAIDLHQAHMDGKEPVTGPDGDKSQMKMMKMMKAALAALVGKSGDKGGKGMAMNVAMVPADRRHEGWHGWLRKLVGNGDVSFDAISSLLHEALPRGAWLREVFQRHCIWVAEDGKLYRQDYAVASDGASVAFSSEPVEVTRKVEYEPVNNHRKDDEVKERILGALNAAGIKTEGLSEEQLLAAYNTLVTKPVEDRLTAANAKIAEHEATARAAEEAEVSKLATELAVNSSLTVDDLKKLGKARLLELKAKAAPVVTGNSGAGGKATLADIFANHRLQHEAAGATK